MTFKLFSTCCFKIVLGKSYYTSKSLEKFNLNRRRIKTNRIQQSNSIKYSNHCKKSTMSSSIQPFLQLSHQPLKYFRLNLFYKSLDFSIKCHCLNQISNVWEVIILLHGRVLMSHNTKLNGLFMLFQ